MDAYDIFKKLTKGLTFKHKVLGVKNDAQKDKAPIKKEEIEIKKEELKTEDLKKKLELEEQNRFRNEHGIKTVGRHIPPALQNFSELVTKYNVSQGLVDTITQCGYTEPTPVQRQALPCLLEGRQIVACAPTGSGKTAAFLVPLLHSLGSTQGGPRALVLCPTRELAHQIYREALRLSATTNLRCSVLKSIKGTRVKEREATFKKSDIVITTPNRLCYLMDQEEVNITLEKVEWLIIDEADKLFEGSTEDRSDFRQQLEQILIATGQGQRQAKEGQEKSRGVRVALFSATHTPRVAKWSRHALKGLINITVGQRNATTDLVDQELLYCGNENGKLVAFRQLVQKGLKPPVLVFVQSKDRAKQLFKELIYDGINVDVIHADRTQTQRDNVVRSFRVGRIWVLICTELMGRGIDFRGVNLVLNYDFPQSAISYIHRVGRAGRAGQRGKAITFFTQDDVVNLRSIAAVMKQSGCEVPDYMLKLKQNPNKRKQLMKKAPHRDKISTILTKPEKRKLEEGETKEDDKSKSTETITNGKNKKYRKVENQPNGPKKAKFNPNRDGKAKINKGKGKLDQDRNTKVKKGKGKLKGLKKKNKKNVLHKKAKNVS
ncbi:probable ATP-dependent RNA helicase DDX52 [Manduca sexta]|uniref:probable ATP-dependent RNA helicase DDX52 n=1 Tax=Manduca sexta TaxID=7130 RepID=UPI00188E3043|nr:probable ATP-dependent RNA helicase DDX52 [Manduca sexta]